MREQVLGPCEMSRSTFESPLPVDWEADAAVGHHADGQPLRSRWDSCAPALAAKGLWTTPGDLARLVVALSRSYQEQDKTFLAPAAAKAVFTKQIDDQGLGVKLAGENRTISCSVRGDNQGYVCRLVAFPATGQGAVIMTNSETGERFVDELFRHLALEYDWPAAP